MNTVVLLLVILSNGVNINPKGNVNLVDDWEIKQPIVIYINGTIEPRMAAIFSMEMDRAEATGQTVIPIFINSYGGSIYSLLGIIDRINRSKLKIATIVVGKAMSAGAAIFTCGDEGMRYISPNATLMIHEASSVSGGKTIEVASSTEELERISNLILEIMSTNIGKHKDYLSNIIHMKGHADWFITAKSAKKLNIANRIGVPVFKVNVHIRETLILE